MRGRPPKQKVDDVDVKELSPDLKVASLMEEVEKLVKGYRHDFFVTIEKSNISDAKLKFNITVYLK